MKFFVIGIDDNQEQQFPDEIRRVLATHSVFSGGVRHREIVAPLLPENHRWIDVVTPLESVFRQYNDHAEIVVFASGDPLFFGFATTIRREMPGAEIVLYPSFNSLQLLAHRLLMPYQEMHIVSLTGRPWDRFDEALISGYDPIGVLTDSKTHTPAAIAGRMLHYGFDNYRMHIGELLGNQTEERVSTWELPEIAGKEFAFPNNLILQKTHPRPRPFGIPEGEFQLLDGRAKMVTKMPVRLLTLSLLELREKRVFWDIGSCTGSVSIEAKLQFPHLQVVAFEKRAAGRELLERNSRQFGTPGIHSVTGDFPEAEVSALPRPDAVFIGGHGGKMKEMVSRIRTVLRTEGVVVFNSVSAESRQLFWDAVEENGLQAAGSTSVKVDDFNTIEVMKAIQTK